MSFLTDLNTGCGAYTAFTYNGSSITLPYYRGGKKTPDQIRTAITNWGGAPPKHPPRSRHMLATILPLMALIAPVLFTTP